MQQIRRHKVFVSYHHENDQPYRDRFERLFADVYNIMDSRSVRIGDIPKGLDTDPPRLHCNAECGFAKIYNWSESPDAVAGWIDEAFRRRNQVIPDNSSVRFAKNWNGDRWYPQRPTKAR